MKKLTAKEIGIANDWFAGRPEEKKARLNEVRQELKDQIFYSVSLGRFVVIPQD